MNDFLWWSGVAAWGVAGLVGYCYAFDWVLDKALGTLGLKRDLYRLIMERLREKTLPGG